MPGAVLISQCCCCAMRAIILPCTSVIAPVTGRLKLITPPFLTGLGNATKICSACEYASIDVSPSASELLPNSKAPKSGPLSNGRLCPSISVSTPSPVSPRLFNIKLLCLPVRLSTSYCPRGGCIEFLPKPSFLHWVIGMASL